MQRQELDLKTRIGWFPTACKSSFRRPNALFRTLWAPASTNMYIDTELEIRSIFFRWLDKKVQREAEMDEP